ncbi:MAG: sulfur carrier protein ThiS [Thermostichales cyanobacterium BF4_bins_65]
MQLWINGSLQTVPECGDVLGLLEHLHLNPRLVAIEYNGEILHRQHWPTTRPQEGDRLEIVTMVGGG